MVLLLLQGFLSLFFSPWKQEPYAKFGIKYSLCYEPYQSQALGENQISNIWAKRQSQSFAGSAAVVLAALRVWIVFGLEYRVKAREESGNRD